MKISLPDNVISILKTLNDAGFQAFVVGGAVRDCLLGREVKDWDITTSALPEQIESLFEHTIPMGKQFGIITVVIESDSFEIASYRQDGEYSDNRHPDSVKFTTSLYDDLSRRDFTINSLAYSPTIGLVDNFRGQKHLESHLISCVGDPNKRFQEDALRMLRAIRFSSQLKFAITQETWESIFVNVELMEKVSIERIQSEFNKMLVCTPTGIGKLVATGIMGFIVPEFYELVGNSHDNPYHKHDMGIHTAKAMEFIEPELDLRLTMLLHDIAKPICKSYDDNGVAHYYGHAKASADMAEEIMRRLKYDNDTIKTVAKLVLYHDVDLQNNRPFVRKWLNKLGVDLLKKLLQVKKADAKAHAEPYSFQSLDSIDEFEEILLEELEKNNCISLKDLAVNGDDLKAIGFKQGKAIGTMLNELLEVVINNPEENTKERLIKIAQIFKEE